MLRSNGTTLTLFFVFFSLAFASLLVAWAQGRQWGDLASRRHYGEALDETEQRMLRRSRRNFWIWAGVSLALAAVSFRILR